MPFHVDDAGITLGDVRARIEATDLVPSRAVLMDDLDRHYAQLTSAGIHTLADFRQNVKTPKKIAALAEKSGIAADYLTLLRREVEGWFPKPAPLSGFTWFEPGNLIALIDKGFKTTRQLYDAVEQRGRAYVFNDADVGFADTLLAQADLTRIQWVSPLTARLLFEAGYTSPAAVAAANAETLCSRLETINNENTYFKGKIGLRDIHRLVAAASYV